MTSARKSPLAKLMLGATGVVFGDIGTSPLYAFRESFIGHHRLPLDGFHVLGVLSMLIWAPSSPIRSCWARSTRGWRCNSF